MSDRSLSITRLQRLAVGPVRPDPALCLVTRLTRDHHVRVDVNDCSVNPRTGTPVTIFTND